MQNKLFIGNLPFKLKEDDIRDLFSKFGEIVEVAVPQDKATGRPRGFAFVTFKTEDSAKQALTLDGHEIDARKIRVSLATGEKRASGVRN